MAEGIELAGSSSPIPTVAHTREFVVIEGKPNRIAVNVTSARLVASVSVAFNMRFTRREGFSFANWQQCNTILDKLS